MEVVEVLSDSDSSDTVILSPSKMENKASTSHGSLNALSDRSEIDYLLQKYSTTNSISTTSTSSKISYNDDCEHLNFWRDLDQPNSEEGAKNQKVSSQSSSNDEASRQSPTGKTVRKRKNNSPSTKQKLQAEKEALRQEKLKEKERKKDEANREKLLKRVLSDNNKKMKPDECLKFITVLIDDSLRVEYGSCLATILEAENVSHKFQSQIVPNTISWIRQEETHSVDDDGKLNVATIEKEADEILLIMSWKNLIENIDNKILSDHIQSVHSIIPNKTISLAIYGLGNYFRFKKNKENREYINEITNKAKKTYTNCKEFEAAAKISRKAIEYALTELQLLYSCSYRVVDNIEDLGYMLFQFTKSVAQKPYKQEKHEKHKQAEWYMSGDNRDCVRVDKHGNGLSRLWNQIFTTFPLARLETAEAISNVYPTPTALMKAYEECKTVKEGEQLLQDICIRRSAGPLTSVRRIGPELSRKIYLFFTSTNADVLIE